MTLIIDTDICPTYEEYIEDHLKIGDAGCCGMYDIGWAPELYGPSVTDYQKVQAYKKYYVLDYISLTVDRQIEGYFIGIAGTVHEPVPYAPPKAPVFDLWDFCIYDYADGRPHMAHFHKLFAYLLRHCKNNHCVALQIEMTDANRYQGFYDLCRKEYAMQQWENVLYLNIE